MQQESIELSTLDTQRGAEEGYELQLTHPKTGEALPATIRVLGVDSDAFREKQREFQRKRTDRMAKGRLMSVPPDQLESEAIELMATVTTGWDGMALEGKPLEFTRDNTRMLYTRFAWIREQVDQAINDRANFLPRSATG